MTEQTSLAEAARQTSSDAIARILIVDDHPGARLWLEKAARSLFPHAEILTADSFSGGRMALAVTPAAELALFDLGLPDGSGVELVRAYKRQTPQGMAVVATLFDDDGHLFDALRAGADGYVLKDDSEAELVRLLQGIHSGQPPLSASIARRVLAHFSAAGASFAPQVPKASPAPRAMDRSPSMPDPSYECELTARETDALKLVAKGFSVPKVAELLGLSKHTVAGYLRDVYRKLAINSRAEATMAAAQRGLIA